MATANGPDCPGLPLVYVHDPEFHDFAELSAPDSAVATLMRLRDEGEIEHVDLRPPANIWLDHRD